MDPSARKQLEENVSSSFSKMMEEITTVWKKLGVAEDLQHNRSEEAVKHILFLMKQISEEENELYYVILSRIGELTNELNNLALELGLEHISMDDSIALIEKDKYLRTQVDALVKEKHTRIKLMQEFRKTEHKFCTMLCLPPHEITSKTGVPSDTDLREMEENLDRLKEERERRYKKFCFTKRELTTILETTEIAPETTFEREVLCYDDEDFVLSAENLKELETFVSKVQTKKTELENRREALIETVNKLWDRLNINNSERQDFLAIHDNCRISTLKKIEQEIERCEKIKKEHIKSYIEVLHCELKDLWKKCHVPAFEQKLFLDQVKKETAEDTLEMYEAEIQKVNKHFKDIEDLLIKIEKRQVLWDLMIDFENRASDPQRFANRGGNLLQEERERKKIQRDLPKLETDIFAAIDAFEESHGKKFLFDGENFQDFIRNQWDQRNNEKENEKLLRQQQRNLLIEHERTVGSTPMKRPPSTMPKSAPSKVMRSNAGLSVLRTPINHMKTPDASRFTKSCRKALATPSRASPRRLLSSKNLRAVLREQNKATNAEDPDNDSSYLDFATELDRPSRSGLRSTVLAPKRVVGGKIASSRSRRSAGRKSIQSAKKALPKLTPVRGKLGLPFLI